MEVGVSGTLCDLKHLYLRFSDSDTDSRGSVPLENEEVWLGPFQFCLWICEYFNKNVILSISSMPRTVVETFTDTISRSTKVRRMVIELKSTWNYSGNLSSSPGDSRVKMHRKQYPRWQGSQRGCAIEWDGKHHSVNGFCTVGWI